MEDDFLQNFMSIGTTTVEDAEAIFRMTIAYLNNLKTEKYNPENGTLIEGLVDKIIVISENFQFDNDFINMYDANLTSFVNSINSSSKNHVTLYFNKVYSDTMKFHNLVTRIKPKSNVGIGPFQPDNCDKSTTIKIITDVIEIIKNSDFLTDRAKNNIIEKLGEVISELLNERTDWGIYFKNMANTIIFISALASIAGGVESVNNLITAKDKLEEANKTVEKTSLTFSNKDIKDVFIIQETPQLNASVVFKLEAENKPLKQEKITPN